MNFTVCSLRYTIHLHETGTDIQVIQELSGNKSSKTTGIYNI